LLRVLALLIIILLYGLLSYWIGMRMWQLLGSLIAYPPKLLYWIVFWFIVLSFFAGHLGEKYLTPWIYRNLTLLGDYWLAFMFYSIFVFGLLEIVRFLIQYLPISPQASFSQFPAAPLLGLSVLATVLVIVGCGWWNARHPLVNHYDISIPKQAGQLKQLHVVAVSDLHLGNIVDNQRLGGLVEMINALNPDIILLPGDIIDGDPLPFIEQDMASNWHRLAPRYGIYAVPGNHDYIGSNSAAIISSLEKTGIKVLRDEVVLVADSLYLVGRDDVFIEYYTGTKRKDLSSIVGGKDVDKSRPLLVMDHEPVNLEEPRELGVDLQLSGHTHRGQLAPLNLITQRVFEVDQGYLCKGNLQVIVSTGFGTWGPPIRVGSRSEVLDIQISFSNP